MALHTYAPVTAKDLVTAGHVQVHVFAPRPCLVMKRIAE